MKLQFSGMDLYVIGTISLAFGAYMAFLYSTAVYPFQEMSAPYNSYPYWFGGIPIFTGFILMLAGLVKGNGFVNMKRNGEKN